MNWQEIKKIFEGEILETREKYPDIQEYVYDRGVEIVSKDLELRIEIMAYTTAAYLFELLTLPESYLTSEEKRQILYENFWDFFGMTKQNVITANKPYTKHKIIG